MTRTLASIWSRTLLMTHPRASLISVDLRQFRERWKNEKKIKKKLVSYNTLPGLTRQRSILHILAKATSYSLMCNRPIMCFWATLAKLWMKPNIWCYTHFLVCIGCMMIRKVLEICLIEDWGGSLFGNRENAWTKDFYYYYLNYVNLGFYRFFLKFSSVFRLYNCLCDI